MLQFDSKSLDLIRKTCKGKKHIKLTAGFFAKGEKTIKVFDEYGEIEDENYIYEIGSITKTFTASLLSKYIFEHKMSLDDSIQKYIKGLDAGRYYPTLGRLATHTAGYPERYPLTQKEFVKLFLDLILGRNQGVIPFCIDLEVIKSFVQKTNLVDRDYKWAYSNFGFALLGYAIGVASGKGYRDTMDDFLSKELGLLHSYTGTFEDRNLHGFSTRNRERGNWKWEENLMAPAGCISATADDLLTYAKINMNEEKPYLPLCHGKHGNISKKYDIGLGWWLLKENNRVIMHGGGTGCFNTYLAIDKDKKVASVVMGNYRLGINSDERIAVSILEDLQRAKV